MSYSRKSGLNSLVTHESNLLVTKPGLSVMIMNKWYGGSLLKWSSAERKNTSKK